MFTAPPHPVAVPAIERELSRLWQSASEAQPPDAPAMMRASVSNLVAFAPTPDEAAEARQKITQLIQRHPCRAILLQVQPDLSADETRAEVALACQTAGGAQLCCEYISLSACGLDGDECPGSGAAVGDLEFGRSHAGGRHRPQRCVCGRCLRGQ